MAKNHTNSPFNEEAPDVSPDGKWFLYSTNREGGRNYEIFIQNFETGKTQNISNSPNWELIARWSTDGKAIYFGTNRDENWEIYSYNLKDKTVKNLTNNDGFDGDPQLFSN